MDQKFLQVGKKKIIHTLVGQGEQSVHQQAAELLTGRNLMSVRLRVTALVNSAADKQLKLEFGSAHRPAVT